MTLFEESHSSDSALQKMVSYCQDPHHKNHVGLTISAPIFWNCRSIDHFVALTRDGWAELLRNRDGKRGPKPRFPSSDLVARPKGEPDLTEQERQAIQHTVASAAAPHSAGILFWHRKGKNSDLHALLANTTLENPPQLRRAGFGHGGANYLMAVRRALNVCIDELNCDRRVNGKPQIETVSQARLARALNRNITPLPVQIYLSGTIATGANIAALVRALGHEVVSINATANLICIRFAGKQRIHRFNLARLIQRSNGPGVISMPTNKFEGKAPAHLVAAHEQAAKLNRAILDEGLRRAAIQEKAKAKPQQATSKKPAAPAPKVSPQQAPSLPRISVKPAPKDTPRARGADRSRGR